MKMKFKFSIRAVCPLFGGVICAGAVLLMASSAQAQNLFVSDYSENVYEFTPGGVQSTFAHSGVSTPNGLAFNSAGDLFVANYEPNAITEITPSGVVSTFASGLSFPCGLAFNSAGDLFEADFSSGNIYEFTTSGAKTTFASGLNTPLGLAFNSAGDLFVSQEHSGTITEITPGGVQSTFASGLSPTDLAFQGEILPMPEPSVLGLLAVGVTALLVWQRRNLAA